ncbi:hypothetical protein Igag_0609 [Ignisphaera aggregans DSM 17230]|uniref:Csa3 N-terminal domain-containing protein n=1 Tax=Ignisphaera aggregans (strain DSM 17230 / JCM 13409 / AQ1.S1) TaxID=583356 RepID=E0SSH1_IGNAA|nr:hypothetical protein Igag_0609 [Ignisphaera aggregans DSM 17230]
MSCIVVSFGWSWEFVSRAIVFRGGLKHGDRVILVVSRARGDYEVKRFRDALYGVERFVEGLGIDFDECVRICEVDVYGDDFLGVVENVSSCIASVLRDCNSLEVYLLGGMRILVLATLFSIDIIRSIVSIDTTVFSGPEDASRVIEIPKHLYRVYSRYTEKQLEVLARLLELGEASIDLLTDNRSIDTVRKTLNRLVRKGLVEKLLQGRRTIYRLTGYGRIIARIYKVYRYGQ